ncbi:Ephrin RBD domain-containing protein [Caenorhabditis elegans]|uniref:Ephrin RBD domain-containing protein n=1 Tax=Caenorhabditis elegans TaxID=6239 RepID=Q19475_CAEEL|nr:Ephrin RBD domain-containing protein [Caenorhabditis elegans]CAA94131.3 Ephrin RBD domain-containing protein [Caenorhabditis elegans]|eukprot:NP_510250.3 Eph(F)riN [Caenorhabditis elegans]
MSSSWALFLLLFVAPLVSCRNYHDVMWNSKQFPVAFKTTPIKVDLGDQLTIICPKAYGMTYEYAKLYWVGETEWSQCWLHEPVWLGVCATENYTTEVKLIFRQTNPIPDGMDFQVGKTYYIISTSTGDIEGINQAVGGLCKYHHMKLAISVVGYEKQSHSKSEITEKNFAHGIGYEIHEVGQLVSSGHQNFTLLTTTSLLFCTMFLSGVLF